MSPLVKVAVLAVVQGLTEFLPISSSGHLVLFRSGLNLDTEGAFLEITLHVGTFFSILVYFRRRLLELARGVRGGAGEGRRYLLWIFVASCPAAAAYLAFGERMEAVFGSPRAVADLLLINGLVLFLSRIRAPGERPLGITRALLMGVAQGFALLPGLSRSGATIVTGRRLGLSPERAAEFSLLMSLPVVAGASLVKLATAVMSKPLGLTWPVLVTGMAVAGTVGYVAIAVLLSSLARGTFWLFGAYCIVVALTVMLIT